MYKNFINLFIILVLTACSQSPAPLLDKGKRPTRHKQIISTLAGTSTIPQNIQEDDPEPIVESLPPIGTVKEIDTSLENLKVTNTFKITTPLGSNSLQWPLFGDIKSRYGKHSNKFNEGINIAAPLGTPVYAAGEGKVIYVGNNVEGYGNLIILKHEGNIMTAYAHLENVKVERNATVKKGEIIGNVGQVGNVDSPQLHFSVRHGKMTVDPEVALK